MGGKGDGKMGQHTVFLAQHGWSILADRLQWVFLALTEYENQSFPSGRSDLKQRQEFPLGVPALTGHVPIALLPKCL